MEGSKDQESASASSENGSEENTPVESLVAGRNKRATAGNRLSYLLEKEGDDELELLFAENEEEEDVEFEGQDGEDASDIQLGSSSDDDDQGPTHTGEDLEGEKEIQKQDRMERRKKRKAQEVFKRPKPMRKRVKVDPTLTSTLPATPLHRPKKKSERVSWIPTPEEGPTRFSSRKQTVQNKEDVHQRMQENEKRRHHQIQVMEAATKRKDAAKAKIMTQADRMVEAARTEKRNAKSLNRWEETEKKRSEEQKARLAALHQRQIQGPVISWWSGMSKWVNGKLVQVGMKNGQNSETSPAKKIHNDQSQDQPLISRPLNEMVNPRDPDVLMSEGTRVPQQPSPHRVGQLAFTSQTSSTGGQPTLSEGSSGFLDGIHYYASLSQQQQRQLQSPQQNAGTASPGVFIGHIDSFGPFPQPHRATVQFSTRNLVILENFDANVVRTLEAQNHILMKKRNGKLQSRHIFVVHQASSADTP